MSVSVTEFWDLLGDSRLVGADELQQLQTNYRQLKGVDQNDGSSLLAQWLVAEGSLTRYQGEVLRGGRSGPFLFGDYRITGRERSGRLAGAFSATYEPTGYPVLLHFLTGASVQHKPRWKALAQQAEIARRMVHPNLSRVYELLDLVTYKLVVLEPLEGQSLAELLDGGKRLSEQDACRIARFVANGLILLHASGQVHGEVRPENIWITPAGQVQLLQPPLARPFDRPPGEFTPPSGAADPRQLATADYLAPELAQPGAVGTAQSDLYALGCTLYEMLAGRPPFAGGTVVEKLQRHASEAIDPLESLGVTAPLAKVVTYLMAKDAKMRYQKASILFDTLGGYVDAAVREPLPESSSREREAFENEVARRQMELRSVRRQFEALPDVQSRFARGAGSKETQADERAEVGGNGANGVQPPSHAAAEPFTLIDTHRESPSHRLTHGERADDRMSRAERTKLIVYFVGGLAVIVGGILLLNNLSSDRPGPPEVAAVDRTLADPTPQSPMEPFVEQPPRQAPESSPSPRETGGSSTVAREATIPDDGQSLWASPTSGAPLSLNYLPPGPQIFLAVRPAALLVHPEGDKLQAALGPRGLQYLDQLKRITGFSAEEIEQVVVGLQAGGIGELEASFVVRLVQPLSTEEIVGRWSGAKQSTHDGKDYYVAGPYAYYVPEEQEGRTIAVTSPKYIRDVLLLDGAMPPLEREMERMLADTDTNRHFTLLFPPKHIFGEAHQAVFSGTIADLKDPLAQFLGDEAIKAAQLSLHLDQHFFAELRIFGTLDISPHELADQMHDRLDDVPKQMRRVIFGMQPYSYSAEILAEFPEMIRVFAEYTRGGAANEQAVLRSYLPAVAGHNLVMASELALAQRGGGPRAAPVAGAAAEPKSLDELLQQPATLSFARDTLEQSLKMLSEELGAEIIILGGDLQLDGITKNQSFGIDLRDQPAQTILEQILLLANPDKTAAGPDDPKQKLVYVIKPNNGKDAIFVTTRAQAEKRGDTLPDAFVVE